VLFAYAEQIVSTMGDALDEVRRSKQAPRDRVVVAASRPFSTRFFPEVLLSYSERYPHTHVTVHEASSGQVYEMLASGTVDLAVVLHQPNSPKVVGTKLLVEELFVVGRAGNPLLDRQFFRRGDLGDLNLMLPAAPLGTRGILERYFAEGGFTLDPRLRFDSVSLMKEMIRRNGYTAICPRWRSRRNRRRVSLWPCRSDRGCVGRCTLRT
jgi:LysR family nitrogen assimilation transcriptional regulator